jgi:hypothetical protein
MQGSVRRDLIGLPLVSRLGLNNRPTPLLSERKAEASNSKAHEKKGTPYGEQR